MKITVSDDRPPILPIVAVGLLAGLVAVAATGLLGVAGMGPSGARSLLAIAVGLLVGLLLKDRVVAAYEARWGSPGDAEEADDDGEPSG